jgi:hypothetical protein
MIHLIGFDQLTYRVTTSLEVLTDDMLEQPRRILFVVLCAISAASKYLVALQGYQ